MKFDYWLGVGGNEPYMALYTAVADIKSFRNSNGVAPNWDAKCRWGRVKSANVDK